MIVGVPNTVGMNSRVSSEPANPGGPFMRILTLFIWSKIPSKA
jgi:hypothetical protein